MSAADEFPARPDGTTWTVDTWPQMCDTIDRLRARCTALEAAVADLLTGTTGVTDISDMTT